MNNYDNRLERKKMNDFIEVCSTRSIPIITQYIKDNNIILEELTDKCICKIISTINDNSTINNKFANNIELIKWEFENLNISENMKYNILQDAITGNHLDVVEYLSITDTHCKKELETIHYNIFYTVCYNGYLDMAKFLIDYQYNNNLENSNLITKIYDYNNVIIAAAKKGFLDILIYLIELSNKFNKDYYRISLKENIIRNSLINNHIHIAQWIIDNWGIEEYPTYLIQIFKDCIAKNVVESIIFMSQHAIQQCSYIYNNALKQTAKMMFHNHHINLDLPILQHLYTTFMTVRDIEQNDHTLIKHIIGWIDNYITLIEPISLENIKLKLIWFVSLSDKYTITFYENNLYPPKITILCPIVQAIRDNNILEACKLLNLNIITNTEDNKPSEYDCTICLDKKNHSIITTCNHQFCLNCIYEWLVINRNSKCPYCRSTISIETLQATFAIEQSKRAPF